MQELKTFPKIQERMTDTWRKTWASWQQLLPQDIDVGLGIGQAHESPARGLASTGFFEHAEGIAQALKTVAPHRSTSCYGFLLIKRLEALRTLQAAGRRLPPARFTIAVLLRAAFAWVIVTLLASSTPQALSL